MGEKRSEISKRVSSTIDQAKNFANSANGKDSKTAFEAIAKNPTLATEVEETKKLNSR
ncbi:MAG: hypothetical protein IBJ09_01015 [Bacteroidia bacterium]|nr:hypothetical protein [Bacteroidia bacterium]